MAMAATHPEPARGHVADNVTTIVKVLMALDGLDQRDLAAELGIDPAAITRTFKGQRKWQIDEIERLSEVFDTPPASFFQPVEGIVRRNSPPHPPSGGVSELQDKRSRNRKPGGQGVDAFRCFQLAA